MTEYAVHNECDTNHVSTVLKDGQEEEEDCHLRHESKYCSKSADDTVNNKADYKVAGAGILKESSCDFLNSTDKGIVRPVSNQGSDCGNGYVVNNEHNSNEDRDTEDTVRNDLVDLIGGRHLLLALLHTGRNDLLDEAVTSVGYDTLHIIVMLFLKSSSRLIYNFLSGIGQLYRCNDLLIVLKELDCVPSLLVISDRLRKNSLNLVNCTL